jgi:mannose-6-phosphate isomerase-like protein (cupin superfamily)
MSPTARETVYVVLDGAFVLTVDGTEEVLGPGDSVHLPQGTVRTVENRGSAPARLLVVMATAAEATS